MAGLKERALDQSAKVLVPILFSERNFGMLYQVARRVAPKDGSESVLDNFVRMWREDAPGALLMKRTFRQGNRRCKTKFVTNMLMRNFWIGAKRRDEIQAKEGIKPPFSYLISPTMHCNLRCVGCYAANYSVQSDLDIGVIDRVIAEGKELGIYFVTILGGEPFIRKDMWDVYRRHNDILFQVFTNATLIDDEAAKRLGHLGNVFPIISIEGFEEETDARRGKGTFQKIMEAMDRLRKAGVLFGFSAMLTSKNIDTIIGDEFNDMLIAKGCLFGWHFLYMPVGRDPDSSLMPTPEQRERMRLYGAARIRKQKPLLICDFWNDAPYVGGCIAGGRYYFHINANGDVEPCIFVHFALDNIKTKSLWEVLRSPFFEAIRARQPYHNNLLRPCMIIDHPNVLREVCQEVHPYPTHPGSESVITSLCGALDQYASRAATVLDPPWQSEFAEKGFSPWSNL